MVPPPDPSQCPSHHDPYTLTLSILLCTGLVISYLPQHYRIISTGTSEGLSPWFLLLGATSSASGMLNLLILQWPLFQCCRVVSGGQCAESLLRFVQVGLQWLLFSIILALYIIYFPRTPRMRPLALQGQPQLDYGATRGNAVDAETPSPATVGEFRKLREQNDREWRTAKGVAWAVCLHLTLLTTLTFVLLDKLPTTVPPQKPLRLLATFCGLSATALAVCQYAPQIVKTANAGLVGALSIGTMLIQVPGSIVFCISIMLGENTDWTSWMPYAVTGLMQACLLIICLFWKKRQRWLGIDDFGNPLPSSVPEHANGERAPLLNGNN
ncbi:hypothetical protein CcaverHIS002_0505560 [Cutaneotrichosporon cavernicola]|uniref:PQ loop repeat protein n=1 Tax=Cutaneotrichosporon cavernicola TaxID=279322 RepID=A0AA48L6T6_9TREE|nr:uncharacterized protein CcaverHIS019_0506080 [Cutaneotrichosporon cavernicola]BEI85155.1 hypothetical protein CcaverHIS002_0505560 [Cutaneotrichosporon cavernicola]BEI92980.1 hypothetical protein CcaverHIS019_0506080 [Cutaneotrichosporon cavernicola]BEJ00756.1 hypothetical protein CcaverHIS631_0506130 [Cutaneotrichosporon cavernicola]BEJ08522.1 hypothetical protein CcaverHIS641_0506160 [Cutaneotrichosporon cavernicola]